MQMEICTIYALGRNSEHKESNILVHFLFSQQLKGKYAFLYNWREKKKT